MIATESTPHHNNTAIRVLVPDVEEEVSKVACKTHGKATWPLTDRVSADTSCTLLNPDVGVTVGE
jgi:hypothetical protein